MAFSLSRLRYDLPVVNPDTGKPTKAFFDFLNLEILTTIEANERAQNNLIEQIYIIQQQQAAQLALINQILNILPGTSAEAVEDISYTGWTLGPQVDLTGVVAGNLALSGTSLQPISSTRLGTYPGEQYGEIRVVEIVGMVETVVYGPSLFITGRDENPSSVPYILNPEDISTPIARSSTGAVSYRLDAKMNDIPVEMQDVRFYLLVNRT